MDNRQIRRKHNNLANLLGCFIISASVGLDHALCEKDLTKESSGQFLSLSRRGPGSCLHAVIDLLSETHNSLVREARKICHQEDRCVFEKECTLLFKFSW